MGGLVRGESKPLGDSNVYALLFGAVLLAALVFNNMLPFVISVILATLGRLSYSLSTSRCLRLPMFGLPPIKLHLSSGKILL